MSKRFSRRDFLKIVAGAAGLGATGLSPVARRVVLEPFVRPPKDIVPGQATWYASACGQCPAGCGIVVRTINGRAKKIEGNPLHPLNNGKLCARGQAGLQVLYNPDRLQNAIRQTGGRGSREFEPVQWVEALDQLATWITSLASPEALVFFGGLMSAHLHLLTTHLLDALGASPPIVYDAHTALEGRAAASQLAAEFFSASEPPVYDLARTEVILSFGANFLETWLSPVAQAHAFGAFRQGQFGGRGFFAQLEPRLSATAASADEWIPLRPGAEGAVALGIGRIIVEENLGHVGSQRPNAVLYQDVDVRTMAEASGVSVETLQRLARIFADADQAVALPGGYPAGQRNGMASMRAVQALNHVIAQVGRTGGVFLSPTNPTATLRDQPRASAFQSVLELVERMRRGEVKILLVHRANPVFELPSAVGFEEALANVEHVISFSPFVDETAMQADLILPDHTYLESWGYRVPLPGADRPLVSSQQPVVQPLYDTRATASVLLALAGQLGGAAAEALPWADEAAYVEEIAVGLHNSSLSAYDAETAAGFWALWRQHGGWWSERAIPQEPEVTGIVQQPLEIVEPTFEGSEEQYPFHLYPYPTITLTDGRGANQPWLQETPDPMTTARWGTWVELNPETAETLGVGNNHIVRVTSEHGELVAPVVVYPGIRPDTVAIPVGQGHQAYGRLATERGDNPLSLLAPVTDPDSGALAWGATRIRVEPTGETRTLARLESLDGEGRETLR